MIVIFYLNYYLSTFTILKNPSKLWKINYGFPCVRFLLVEMFYNKIFLLLFSIIFVFSFDAHKFEKCDQKPFCKRLRNQEYKSDYVLDSSNLQLDHQQLSGVLNEQNQNNIYNDPIHFKLTALENGIFRLQMRENSNAIQVLKKRNEAKDVLLDTIKQVELNIKDFISQGSLSKDFNLKISQHPFQLILTYQGKELLVFNGNQKLKIENQFREKFTPSENSTEPAYDGETGIGFDVFFPDSKNLYGIPERATDLSLKSTIGDGINSEPYRLYNLDVYRYEVDNPIGLYGSIPMIMSVTPQGSVGIFQMNPSETFIDVSKNDKGASTHWMSETGLIDLFILPGPSPKRVISQMAYLTGTTPLPQLFSLGYHQCRWNYKDEPDVKQVNEKMLEHDIPYDVLWLDIEHTDDKKYFTWDKHNFPTPIEMQENLAKNGRKMVTISDPHIKRTNGYFVHDHATANGYYVKKNNGNEDYEGHCWPGSSSWLDFLNPEVRKWYASLYSFENYKGATKNLYTWIDMNEPSVFSGPEITMDKSALHHGGIEHREVHNQYGFYQGLAVYQGHLERANHQDRPFILTRSFFAGSQRYAAVWTGDNTAVWEHLDRAQSMLMSLGMTGLNFVGADVGGFFDNPTEELLVRWYQAGAFYPFFRGHAEIQTKRREPYLFGEENTKLIRAAIIRRYSLIPYYYTLFQEASKKGTPVFRPLLLEYPLDERTYTLQNQFLIGKDIMVKPVIKQGESSTSVYIPSENPWYDYQTGEKYEPKSEPTIYTPKEKIPVFQRGGSILPLKMRVRKSTAQMLNDPYTLQIALDQSGNASGELYVDDGHSFNYKNGEYSIRKFYLESRLSEATIGMEIIENGFKLENGIEKIIIFGFEQKPKSISFEIQDSSSDIKTKAILNYEFENNVLTIKKPFVFLNSSWKILIQK